MLNELATNQQKSSQSTKNTGIKMFQFKTVGLLLAGLLAVNLTGCSTVGKGVNAVGSGVVYAAEGVDKAINNVEVTKTSDDNYTLTETFYEPVRSLDSWSMRIESRELCPKGYVYVNRFAQKTSEFAYSDNQCEGDMACEYKLQWQIKCQDVPKEQFSLFGKT